MKVEKKAETGTTLGNYIGLFLLVGIPFYFGYVKQPTEMGISVGAIGLAMLFLNLDKIAKFKALGVEAEMRDVVQKAYATIEELKNLAVALSIPIVNQIAMMGKITNDPTNPPKLVRVALIVENLRSLDVSEEQITVVCANLTSLVNRDINSWLLQENSDKADLFNNSEILQWTAKKWREFIEINQLKTNETITKDLDGLKKIQERH